ncbi:hypothetical protein TIFTF001_005747 [Ficus carica]|uniref:Uncharacterized protein n=1 Tax=Ficus carica TaxID=3494 RepID=A0AA87ZMN7_FICCA|nr:hypothetical protein TIFTF001_005747 [Ficus carica]
MSLANSQSTLLAKKSSQFADSGVAQDQLGELLLVTLRIRPSGVEIHVTGDNAGVHSDGVVANDGTKIDLGIFWECLKVRN